MRADEIKATPKNAGKRFSKGCSRRKRVPPQ
jgi:hypothetical protein